MLTVDEAIVRWASDQINVHYSKIESVHFSIEEPHCDTCGYSTDIAQIKYISGNDREVWTSVEVDDIAGLIRNITARIHVDT